MSWVATAPSVVVSFLGKDGPNADLAARPWAFIDGIILALCDPAAASININDYTLASIVGVMDAQKSPSSATSGELIISLATPATATTEVGMLFSMCFLRGGGELKPLVC
jgi:hypothetical protein